MKQIAFLISFLLFLNFSAYSQDKSFSFKGQVHSYNEPLKGARVEVVESGELIYETITGGSGKFDFELQAEKQYMVEISMEELTTKVIWINTKGTKDLDFKVPTYGFDVYLKKDKPGPLQELAEIPVALIKYQDKKKEFFMDKTYDDAVNNKKESIKENSLQRR